MKRYPLYSFTWNFKTYMGTDPLELVGFAAYSFEIGVKPKMNGFMSDSPVSVQKF